MEVVTELSQTLAARDDFDVRETIRGLRRMSRRSERPSVVFDGYADDQFRLAETLRDSLPGEHVCFSVAEP